MKTEKHKEKNNIGMNYDHEFLTVDILLKERAVTKYVDAFTLAYVKAERQVRKIFTHLVFQQKCFENKNINLVKDPLIESKQIYFKGFINGFNYIYPKSLGEIFGNDKYESSIKNMKNAKKLRDKIFHGQSTGENLKKDKFIEVINEIKFWCENLSLKMKDEIDFGGFERNSFVVNKKLRSNLKFNNKIKDIEYYKTFIREVMER